jgi:Mn2+/Fe2+ NRAMP family transporter
MWVLVLAVVLRFLFVSLIAKYQLCNQHGESVLDGLVRLHRWYAPLLFVAVIVLGHVLGSFMSVGIGESCRNLAGVGEIWQWALLGNSVALLIVFQPAYPRVEFLFKVLLALMSVSFIGTALWVGPSPSGIVEGLYKAEIPEQSGQFGPLLVAVAMIGAVGGSIMNLVYPYLLEAKGWRGPQFRRVQLYDFLLAVGAMIVLNLSIWSLGAELLHPRGLTIEKMDDLPRLLSEVLGQAGRNVFYLGIFAAVFTSLVGQSLGLALMGSHAWILWQENRTTASSEKPGFATRAQYENHRLYRWIVVWCVISPLVWTLPGMPDSSR